MKITSISESKIQEAKDRLNRHRKGNKVNDIMFAYNLLLHHYTDSTKLTWLYAWIAEQVGGNAEAVARVIRKSKGGKING